MKREDQTYGKWLDKLKNTEPVLNAPEELTNDILNKIKTLPSGTSLLKEAKGKSKTNRILLSVSKISGIAAALLLCFLISETIFFSQDKQYPTAGTQKVACSKKAAIYPNNGRNI